MLFQIIENNLDSEESRFNLWGNAENYNFFKPELRNEIPLLRNKRNFIEGAIQIGKAVKKYNRSVYTFWDFLGDVGGLLGIL